MGSFLCLKWPLPIRVSQCSNHVIHNGFQPVNSAYPMQDWRTEPVASTLLARNVR